MPPVLLHQRRLSRPKKSNNNSKRCGELQNVGDPTLITTKRLSSLKKKMDDSLRLLMPTPTLPPSFFSLFKALRVLDLRKVGLQRLPPQIIELGNLQKLDLRYNNLTYLPSQIALLPNLQQLQIDDVRHRKSRLIKEVDVKADDVIFQDRLENCTCSVPTDGRTRIPTIPTLAQLCARTILSTIPNANSSSDDTEYLTWEDLEPFYSTGKFEEDPDQILPLPSHLLPTHIPVDICSTCCQTVFPAHAQFDKLHVVALCRVRLRYIFCSHQCYRNVIEQGETLRMEEEARSLLRQTRFHAKDHGSIIEIWDYS